MDLNLKKHLREKGRLIHALIWSLTKGQHMSIRPKLPLKRGMIYDLYKSSERYDESVIKAAFPEDSQEALHRAKSILFDEIIAGVVSHEKNNGRRDLYRHLIEANHLRETGMDEPALIRAYDAIRLAVGMEAMNELLEATRICRKLIGSLDPADRNEDQLLALEEWALAGTEETMHINRLEAERYRLALLPAAEHQAELARFEANVSALQFPALVRNQIQYRIIRHYIARQRRDTDTCQQECTSIFELGTQHSHVLLDKDIRDTFFYAITFLATLHADRKEFAKAEKYQGKILSLAKKWGGGLEANPSLNASYMFTNLAIKITSRDWKAAHELAKKVYQDVVRNKVLNNVSMEVAVLHIASRGAFYSRDYSLTRKLTNALAAGLASSNKGAHRSIWSAMVCLQNLMCYLELGDPHLRVAVKEERAWLSSLGTIGKYESIILAFFKEVGETVDCKPTTASLFKLKSDLQILFQDSQFARYKYSFPLEIWVDSKVAGKDIREFDLS